MHGGRLECGRLAGEQRVFSAGLAQENAPGESELAAARIGAHQAACGGDRDLQSPAAAEEGYARGKHGFDEFDLADHRVAAAIDIECRSRHRDTVIVLERHPCGQRGAVRRAYDVHMQGWVEATQNPRVSGSRVIAQRRRQPRPNLGDVAIDDQNARAGRGTAHAAASTASSLPATAARKMCSSCAASTGIGLPDADGSIAASLPMMAALSMLTPMSASECGILSSRRMSSTQARNPSKPRAGRSSTRAITSALPSIARRLKVTT